MRFDMQKYVYSESVFNTFKEFPSTKVNSTKNAFFFLSQAPTHQSFTFNL